MVHRRFIDECYKNDNKIALNKYLRLLRKLSMKGGEYETMYETTLKYIERKQRQIGGVKPPIPIAIEDVHRELVELYQIHKTLNEDIDNKTFNALVDQLKVTYLKVYGSENSYILECYIPKKMAQTLTEAGDKYPNTENEMHTQLMFDLKRTTYKDKLKEGHNNKTALVAEIIKRARLNEIDDFFHLQDFALSVIRPLTDLVLGFFCSKRLGIYHDDSCIIREGGKFAMLSQGTKTQVCKKIFFNLAVRKNMIYDLDQYVKQMTFAINAVNNGTKLIPCDKQYLIHVSYIYPPKTLPFKSDESNEDYYPREFIKLKFQFKNEVFEKKVNNTINNNSSNEFSFVNIASNIPMKAISASSSSK